MNDRTIASYRNAGVAGALLGVLWAMVGAVRAGEPLGRSSAALFLLTAAVGGGVIGLLVRRLRVWRESGTGRTYLAWWIACSAVLAPVEGFSAFVFGRQFDVVAVIGLGLVLGIGLGTADLIWRGEL